MRYMEYNSNLEGLSPLRQQIWSIINKGVGVRGKLFNVVLILLIVLSIVVLPLEFLEVFEKYKLLFIVFEIVITIFFTLEYLLRIYAAPKRLKYIFSFFGIIDLLSIAPFFIGLFNTQYVRALRLIRLVRIIKLGHMQTATVLNQETAEELQLMEGEEVLHTIRKHPLSLIIHMIIPLLCNSVALLIILLLPTNPIAITSSAVVFIFAMVYLYKSLLDYNYDVIYVTSRRLIFQDWHLFGRHLNQVLFSSITNVKPKFTGIISYMLGYGNVSIETAAVAAGNIEHTFVKNHEDSCHIIMNQCALMQEQMQANPNGMQNQATQIPVEQPSIF